MPGLRIDTETFFQAPRERAGPRHEIGVGEAIGFRANRPGIWDVPGANITGRRRQVAYQWTTPGNRTVSVRSGARSASVTIHVRAPSGVHVDKIRDLRPAELRHPYGAGMVLRFTLTPRTVSFRGLHFWEERTPPVRPNGYYAAHPSFTREHDPVAGEVEVGAGNTLTRTDIAAFSFNPAGFNWPLTAGGFSWDIPQKFRVGGGTAQPMPRPMTQAFRIDPTPRAIARPPFHGTTSLWKGGQTASRSY